MRARSAELDEDDWLKEGVMSEARKAIIAEPFGDVEAKPPTFVP